MTGRAAPRHPTWLDALLVRLALLPLLLIPLIVVGVTSYALSGQPNVWSWLTRGGNAAALPVNDSERNILLSGIGSLRGRSECVATFVNTGEGSSNAPAFALTAGRCLDVPSPNAVVRDQPSDNLSVTFQIVAGTSERQIVISVRRVTYATVKGNDLAIVELDTTQDALAARGFRPFDLTNEALADDADVIAVGSEAPATESAQVGQPRATSCHLDGRASLLEDDRHFTDVWRTDCSLSPSGQPGMALLTRDSTRLVAVIGPVASAHSGADCALARPCEVGPTGVQVSTTTSYATEVVGLAACFEASGAFALNQSGCRLDAGKQVDVRQTTAEASGLQQAGVPNGPRTAWNVTLTSTELTFYRYKSGPVGATDCRNPEGYSPVVRLAADNLIDDPLPAHASYVVLCILGGWSSDFDRD